MTIKEIAQMCGVSRGTVDRVLNKRGYVKEETAERIRAVAKECGYVPNYAAKALAIRKKDLIIGVILFSDKNPFIAEMLTGIRKAMTEFQYYGLSARIRLMENYSEAEQLQAIEEMPENLGALLLNPINSKAIADRIADLAERGIPTFTLGGDLENSRRLCYIGTDYNRGGQLAAGVIRMMASPNAVVGVIGGVSNPGDILGHSQRLNGFVEHLGRTRPDITIAQIVPSEDDDFVAYDNTLQMLKDHPEISWLQVLTAGLDGVNHAVAKAGKAVSVVAFDLSFTAKKMLRDGSMKAVIYQYPERQGYLAFQYACQYIVDGTLADSSGGNLTNELIISESITGE